MSGCQAGPRAAQEAALLPLKGHWAPENRAAIEELIRGVEPGDLCVFDFDNTVLCDDIGEASFGYLAGPSGPLPKLRGRPGEALYADYLKLFETPEGALLAEDEEGLHGRAYTWLVQIAKGLSPQDLIEAAKATMTSPPSAPVKLGQHSIPRPFIRPEVASLIAALRRAGARVAVVSASNVWAVRWMVAEQLNPALGDPALAIPPEDVVGITCFLKDAKGQLLSDRMLLADPRYAKLDPARLRELRISDEIVVPVSAYAGKVATIITRFAAAKAPLLACGDSGNDYPMLLYARNALIFARLGKGKMAQRTRQVMAQNGQRWLVQPVTQGPAGALITAPSELAPEQTEERAELARWTAWRSEKP